MLRRKRLPPTLAPRFDAFLVVVERVERAKQSLTEAMPTTRLPGRPLPDALSEFEELLRRARSGMDGWRDEAVQDAWDRARQGLDEAIRVAETLRLEAPRLGGFEGLIGAIGDLIAPLEAFQGAAERFRALRV